VDFLRGWESVGRRYHRGDAAADTHAWPGSSPCVSPWPWSAQPAPMSYCQRQAMRWACSEARRRRPTGCTLRAYDHVHAHVHAMPPRSRPCGRVSMWVVMQRAVWCGTKIGAEPACLYVVTRPPATPCDPAVPCTLSSRLLPADSECVIGDHALYSHEECIWDLAHRADRLVGGMPLAAVRLYQCVGQSAGSDGPGTWCPPLPRLHRGCDSLESGPRSRL